MTIIPLSDDLDERIDEQRSRLEGCRQAMTLSRAIVVAAALVMVLVFTVAVSYRTPIVVFSALTAMIGGVVWLGANRTSAREAESMLADLEQTRARRDAPALYVRELGTTLH